MDNIDHQRSLTRASSEKGTLEDTGHRLPAHTEPQPNPKAQGTLCRGGL